jgi:hypothetical protein
MIKNETLVFIMQAGSGARVHTLPQIVLSILTKSQWKSNLKNKKGIVFQNSKQ